jgi:hypothetical protein
MSETELGTVRSKAPKTYKRLMFAFGLFAAVALAAGTALEAQLVGVGLYAVGLVASVAVPAVSEYTLFDERDDAIHRRASGATLAVFGWLSALVFPSLVALSTTEYFAWGPASAAVGWMTAIVFAAYGVAVGYYS